MTIGEKLQKAREAHNLSLVELQEKTKIQLRYLEAIENDNFKALPGEYNTKLFLRSYARQVGIDPDEIIREYQGEPVNEHIEAYNKTATHGSRTEQHQGNPKMSKAMKIVPTVLLILVFLIIIGSVSYAFVKEHNRFEANSDVKTEYSVDNKAGKADNKKSNSKDSKKETTKQEKPKKVKKKKPKSAMKMQVTSNTLGQVNMDVTHIKDKATLVLNGSQGRCWVSVVADGQSLYQGVVELGAKEVVNVPSQAKVVNLQLGNAPMVSVKINGKTLDYGQSEVAQKQVTINMNLDYQAS